MHETRSSPGKATAHAGGEGSAEPAANEGVEFHILGPLEFRHAHGRGSIDAPKERALLGVLLLHPNEVVSIDRLIDELWGERPPATAKKIVQTYVSHLRRLLGPELIVTRPPGYVLLIEADALDAGRFRRVTGEARQLASTGHVEQARTLYREALALRRGPPLADVVFESFARSEVEQLDEEWLHALTDRIECELVLGRHDAVFPSWRHSSSGTRSASGFVRS